MSSKTDATPSMLTQLWAPVLVSIISSLIVGFGSAYLTAQITLTRMEERVSTNTANIAKNAVGLDNFNAQRADERDRLVRMETKMDMMLQMRPAPPVDK